YLNKYDTYDALEAAIDTYISFYHNERYQERLKRLEPLRIQGSSRIKNFYYSRCLLDREQFRLWKASY
ncbi:IS3 family transposase, partial [Solibacillus cecembensis]|uniref:IS3 family transposase n=1 Tax=Solibacillus cecembensis TaxID=459347 RepID=UPI003D0112B9